MQFLYGKGMSHISPELRTELSERAREYYPNVLPYHNWDHALDMMDIVADLADRSINPEIKNKRNLLVVTAAWHDAQYAIEDLGEFSSKEERSAYLAVKKLPELSAEDAELLFDGIIDTTVSKTPKTNLFGEVTHAADVGYFAATPERFMARLALMRQEWGSPTWDVTIERTVAFGRKIIEDTKEFMPKVLSKEDSDAWISQIVMNLENLQAALNSNTLEN